MNKPKGLVHLYTGTGKGKTTAAIGLAVRMKGCGGKVLFCQFLKGNATGELVCIEKLGIQIKRTPNVTKFTRDMDGNELDKCRNDCIACFNTADAAMKSGEYNMIVLDEIVDAVNNGFVTCEQLLGAIGSRSEGCEIVMTGHNTQAEIIAAADYVSNVECIKHPYQKGVKGRRGVEF